MTSVQNHLQLLSGNKYFILIFFLFIISSCSSSRVVTKTPKAQVVKAESSQPKEKDKSGLPVPGIDVKKTLPVDVKIKVDTVEWIDVSSSHPAIEDKQSKNVTHSEGLDIKEEYNIKLLIPLNSDELTDPASSRFVNFYAGALQALEILDDEGIKLNVKVIDTEEGSFSLKDKFTDVVSSPTDVIIGPFNRDDLKIVAEECKVRYIPLISPWQTSTKITNENPYYIQMKPNLKEHYTKLAEASATYYQKGEVVIIGLATKETDSWIKYFQDAVTESKGIKDFYSTYYVSKDSLNLGPTAFHKMLSNPKIKVVIIPNYSYSDEDFIYSCIRRLSAEKGSRYLSVMGLPILYDSEKIDFDYYHSLNMQVVMSDFVDEDHGKIREFRRNYLDMYGEIPSPEAVKGYDLMLYLGRNLWKYGKNFQHYLSNEATTYLQSTYDIRKSNSDDSVISDDPDKFDFYENKHLDIIEFRGNKWLRKSVVSP